MKKDTQETENKLANVNSKISITLILSGLNNLKSYCQTGLKTHVLYRKQKFETPRSKYTEYRRMKKDIYRANSNHKKAEVAISEKKEIKKKKKGQFNKI